MNRIGSFFAPLAIKIFAGVTVALLIAIGILYWMLGNANERIESLRNDNAQCEAGRRVQNEAIQRAGQELQRQQEVYSQALATGQQQIQAAQGRVRVVRQTAPNNCATPREIMGAGL